MKNSGKNMMKLAIVILIITIIILIGIVINKSNIINNQKENKAQQLEEITNNKTYIEMQKHLSEVEEYYERGKSDASVVILRAMYNSNTLTQEYPGCSSGIHTTRNESGSDSDSCSGVIPLTYQKDGKYYLLNSITSGAASGHWNNCNDCQSSGSATITFYTYNSINKTKISNISSANGGDEKVDMGGIGAARKLTIALFEQNITEDADSIYYEGSTGAWTNSYCTWHDYAQSIARGEIQTVVATYIELTV